MSQFLSSAQRNGNAQHDCGVRHGHGFENDGHDGENGADEVQEDSHSWLSARTLLWDEIKGRLQPPEVDEVLRLLGPKLVEKNAQLHSEVVALIDIMREFQERNDEEEEKRALLL